MKLTSDKENEYYVIGIEGDLDASSCIILDKTISEAVSNGEKKIIIDCGRLNYISSAGLGVFMSYLQDFENNKISMVLFNLSDKVKGVFQILGLDQLIKLVNTKEEAKSIINGK
jgi:anti-sigma B factor antagonist